DGIHPNPAGVRVIVERILPTVEAFLKTLAKA
ncbi:MAG: arylesterase, partial [Rhabdaerophilum sp.]